MAACRGVLPLESLALASAPASSKRLAASAREYLAAKCKAVSPAKQSTLIIPSKNATSSKAFCHALIYNSITTSIPPQMNAQQKAIFNILTSKQLIYEHELVISWQVYDQTKPPRRVAFSVPSPVYHVKERICPNVFPRAQQTNLPASSPHYLFRAVRSREAAKIIFKKDFGAAWWRFEPANYNNWGRRCNYHVIGAVIARANRP